VVQYATCFPENQIVFILQHPQFISVRGETELCAHISCCHSGLYQLHVFIVMVWTVSCAIRKWFCQ